MLGTAFSIEQRLAIFILRVAIKSIWVFDFVVLHPRQVVIKRLIPLFLALFYGAFIGYVLYFVPHIQDIARGVLEAPLAGFITDSPYLTGLMEKEDYPVLINDFPPPQATTTATLVMDKGNNKVLYEKDSEVRLAPASTTKLMTAMVALDIYETDEILEIPAFCQDVEGTKAWLPGWTKFKVEDLLYALLVNSSADAACALSNGKYPPQDFIWRMNRKASDIGMSDTFFTNTIGLDGVEGSHYSTAKDLYKLALKSMSNATIRKIVSTEEYDVLDVDGAYVTTLTNTNQLLWDISQTIGVKTGTTEAAGEVLIYEYKDGPINLVIIVMGSEDRFFDTSNLLYWALSKYSWE
jgi:serine-type D-Ala-D-Ala carboxypeptidase (penicillin-binding protein 5/6)